MNLYQIYDENNDLLSDHQQTQCKRFNGSSKELCHEYEVKLGLQARKSKVKDKTGKRPILWKFVQNKFSIMNSLEDIEDVWMDRETYQKNFKALSEREGAVAEMNENFLGEKSRQQIVFSGLYDLKRGRALMSDIKISNRKLKTPSFPKSVSFMTFQLKHNKKVIKELNQPVLGLEIKLIHKDGTYKKIPNSLSPFSVRFDMDRNYANKKFYVDMLNPKTEELMLSDTISIRLKKKQQKKREDERDRKNKRKTEEKETDFAFLLDDLN